MWTDYALIDRINRDEARAARRRRYFAGEPNALDPRYVLQRAGWEEDTIRVKACNRRLALLSRAGEDRGLDRVALLGYAEGIIRERDGRFPAALNRYAAFVAARRGKPWRECLAVLEGRAGA